MIKKMTHREMNPANNAVSERKANICAYACTSLCKMGEGAESSMNTFISIQP